MKSIADSGQDSNAVLAVATIGKLFASAGSVRLEQVDFVTGYSPTRDSTGRRATAKVDAGDSRGFNFVTLFQKSFGTAPGCVQGAELLPVEGKLPVWRNRTPQWYNRTVKHFSHLPPAFSGFFFLKGCRGQLPRRLLVSDDQQHR